MNATVGGIGVKMASSTVRVVIMSMGACMIGCCPNGWPSVNTRMANKHGEREREIEREGFTYIHMCTYRNKRWLIYTERERERERE